MAELRGCARCGGTHEVEWQKLTHPIVDADGSSWEYWASCPNNGEPILMHVTEK